VCSVAPRLRKRRVLIVECRSKVRWMSVPLLKYELGMEFVAVLVVGITLLLTWEKSRPLRLSSVSRFLHQRIAYLAFALAVRPNADPFKDRRLLDSDYVKTIVFAISSRCDAKASTLS